MTADQWAGECRIEYQFDCVTVHAEATREGIARTIERAVREAVEAERERCARVAEEYGEDEEYDAPQVHQSIAGKDVAARIRASAPHVVTG